MRYSVSAYTMLANNTNKEPNPTAKTSRFCVHNLDCANCARKIETHLKKLPDVQHVALDFATLTLHIDMQDIEKIRRAIKSVEPLVDISPKEQRTGSTTPVTVERNHTRDFVTLSVASLLFILLLIYKERLHHTPLGSAEYAVALVAYLIAGWRVIKNAWSTIRKGRLFDENVLMVIATVGAFGIHAIEEAVGVMLFYKVGELLQNLAVARSRKSIHALMAVLPEYANLKTATSVKRVAPRTVAPGAKIIVKAGEKVPLDGIITVGSSHLNTSALTGESVPRAVKPGSLVLAGSINTTNLLTIRVTSHFADSSIAKILDLVENATAKKSKTERFIYQFATIYTPIIVGLALLTALLPPLLIPGQTFAASLYRALVLLVISCPCALLISIPLGYFGGIGGASRRGILVKGATFLDTLASTRTVVFDKTGTLTRGVFTIQKIVTTNSFSDSDILAFAAVAESYSTHPIAQSIAHAQKKRSTRELPVILEHQEIPGLGVKAHTEHHSIIAGSDALLHREHITHSVCVIAGTVVHVAINGTYAGHIVIGDTLKVDAKPAITQLRREGVQTIIMLTGDNQDAAHSVANTLGLDAFHAGLLPEDKVTTLEHIMREHSASGKIAFVGDGINDAPVLARADVGIAMGSLGSDVAIETADVVLVTDHLEKVAEAIRLGKKTRTIVWQNIIFALAVKGLFVVLGATGNAGMWEAVFADVGTALIAVLNASRAL